MTLLTAHRILIGAAIVFFIFYALWEFTGGGGVDAAGSPWRGGAGLLAAAGLGLYARTLSGRGEGRRDDDKEGR